MLLCNTTAVVLIALGLMTFAVWQELKSGKVCVCVGGGGQKPQNVVLIAFGPMTLGVGHERDSGIERGGGGRTFWRFSQTRYSSKVI